MRPPPGTLEIWYEDDEDEWIEIPYYQLYRTVKGWYAVPGQQPGYYQ